jgi:hypothetical protein
MKDYSYIFNGYYTEEGIPYYLLNKSVIFPHDKSLSFYARYYVDEDIAWTILSYQLYGTIDYWWVLSSLNKSMIFYAERGSEILVIHPNSIESVVNKIK